MAYWRFQSPGFGKVIFISTEDVGSACARRFRGWTLALRRDSGNWLCDLQQAYDFFVKPSEAASFPWKTCFGLRMRACMLEEERKRCVARERKYDPEFENMLTNKEKQNLEAAGAKLDKDSKWPQSLRMAVKEQSAAYMKDNFHLRNHRHAVEPVQRALALLCGELASLGFAVTPEIAQIYGQEMLPVWAWPNPHERCGNTQHVANAAVVILAALCSAELFPEQDLPPGVLQPCCFSVWPPTAVVCGALCGLQQQHQKRSFWLGTRDSGLSRGCAL
ncbi:unnamed protein product [Durusdinium trenchii]|uniref:Uncharacterized protein n=1 Tax=Durusdinium trenchii TaxID=1381693 RepID=A0ABP0LER9_9DINO